MLCVVFVASSSCHDWFNNSRVFLYSAEFFFCYVQINSLKLWSLKRCKRCAFFILFLKWKVFSSLMNSQARRAHFLLRNRRVMLNLFEISFAMLWRFIIHKLYLDEHKSSFCVSLVCQFFLFSFRVDLNEQWSLTIGNWNWLSLAVVVCLLHSSSRAIYLTRTLNNPNLLLVSKPSKSTRDVSIFYVISLLSFHFLSFFLSAIQSSVLCVQCVFFFLTYFFSPFSRSLTVIFLLRLSCYVLPTLFFARSREISFVVFSHFKEWKIFFMIFARSHHITNDSNQVMWCRWQ